MHLSAIPCDLVPSIEIMPGPPPRSSDRERSRSPAGTKSHFKRQKRADEGDVGAGKDAKGAGKVLSLSARHRLTQHHCSHAKSCLAQLSLYVAGGSHDDAVCMLHETGRSLAALELMLEMQ